MSSLPQRVLMPILYKPSPLPPQLSDGRGTPRALACSAVDRTQQRLFALRELDRKLCEDMKTPLEHLMPKYLLKSTFRIVVTQGSFVLSNYANDQLQQDIARDKLVADGQLSQEEADEAADEWENREWKLRWESFPNKLTEALLKYHAIVLVMRCYEHVASTLVDKISMDALTIDTFKCAKRLDQKAENRIDVGRQMFGICGQANLIAFLADYSVHQLILGYGYYKYIRERRRRRENRNNAEEEEEEEIHPIGKQSATLVLSRGLGLAFTAVGGAAGSMLYPGWGTLLGSNLGDSLGGVVSEGTSKLG